MTSLLCWTNFAVLWAYKSEEITYTPSTPNSSLCDETMPLPWTHDTKGRNDFFSETNCRRRIALIIFYALRYALRLLKRRESRREFLRAPFEN